MAKTMEDIVTSLTESNPGLKASTAKAQVKAVVDVFAQALLAGESIKMPGLGTFSVVERSARTARNPRTGENIEVPAKKTVKFKVAPQFKRELNGEAE